MESKKQNLSLCGDVSYNYKITKREKDGIIDYGIMFYDIKKNQETIYIKNECSVCFDEKPCRTNLYSCSHCNVCEDCYKHLTKNICPICRSVPSQLKRRRRRVINLV
jgi:hypothetical protein